MLVEDVWFSYDRAPVLGTGGETARAAARAGGAAVRPRGAALQGASLSVAAGERVALIGRNGSGKSTLARLLNGLLRPQRGRVVVGGLDTARHDPAALAAVAGSVFQNPDHQLFSRSVREEVAFGPRNLALPAAEVEQRAADALGSVGLVDLAARPPATLGFAQRRLVAIASALAMRPAVLVLDEPFAGLPWPHGAQIVELLRALAERGMAVVVISHQMRAVAELASRCVVLDAGRVIADAPAETLLSDGPLLGRAALAPPAVVRLGTALTSYGFSGRAVRVDGFVQEYRRVRGRPGGPQAGGAETARESGAAPPEDRA